MTDVYAPLTPGSRPPRGFHPDDVAPTPLAAGRWRVAALALDIAGTCNLACRYCAEAATQPRRRPMTAETLDAACEFLFRDARPDSPLSLRFGSGEPLLAFHSLRRVAEQIERRVSAGAASKLAVFLTTNGTLVDDEKSDWLAASGWHVKISLDGPEAVHNAWRVAPGGRGTFAQVSSAVARLARRMPERLSVTAVLCRGADPQAVFDGIAALGVRRIELVPVAHHDERVRPDAADVQRYAAFVQAHARRCLDSSPDEMPPSLVRFERCVVRAMGYDNYRVPCGAGRSFLGIGPGGDIYPCFRFVGVEQYRLGRLADGLDEPAVAAFHRGAGRAYEERTPCSQCWAAALCGGPCFACAEMFGPGAGQPLPLHCAYTLADARAAVWLAGRLSRRDPARLLGFLRAPELTAKL